jgi:hypothetical protein
MSYEPQNVPDPMGRDGWIALGVMVLTCLGVASLVVGAVHLVRYAIAWLMMLASQGDP